MGSGLREVSATLCLFLHAGLLPKSDWVTAVDFRNDQTPEKNHSTLALDRIPECIPCTRACIRKTCPPECALGRLTVTFEGPPELIRGTSSSKSLQKLVCPDLGLVLGITTMKNTIAAATLF